MSPTRRDFLAAAAATGAIIALTPELADAAPTVVPPLPVVDAHGLPPSRRLFPVDCGECGNEIGLLMLDEFDRGYDLVCGACHRDAVSELEGDLEGERDNTDAVDDLREDARGAVEDIEDLMREIQADVRDGRHDTLPRSLERVMDAIRDAYRTIDA